MLCSQRDRKEYYYSINQFRKDLVISEKYSNTAIAVKILEPSQERIKESDSDLWFEYTLICRNPTKGRKPKADTIVFKIKNRKPISSQKEGKQYEQYSFVYNTVNRAMKYPTTDKLPKALDIICESGRLDEVYDRCCYYDDKICSGEITTEHANNSLLKMLREEFKIK
ncbi:MAG TPA: RepB family plasmid replication initiator protein [bacterium]|nr:RepB family plasmid replication initiator protein [bacterium]